MLIYIIVYLVECHWNDRILLSIVIHTHKQKPIKQIELLNVGCQLKYHFTCYTLYQWKKRDAMFIRFQFGNNYMPFSSLNQFSRFSPKYTTSTNRSLFYFCEWRESLKLVWSWSEGLWTDRWMWFQAGARHSSSKITFIKIFNW